MRGEKEKMLAGEWFDPRNEELTADRDRATLLMQPSLIHTQRCPSRRELSTCG